MLKNNKILIILLIFVTCISFSFNVFAGTGTNNVDTSSHDRNVIKYLSDVTSNLRKYCEENNISYTYYAICSQTNVVNFSSGNDEFFIILFNNKTEFITTHGGCWSGGGPVNIFYYDVGSVNHKNILSCNSQELCGPCKVYYTNYSNDIINSNINDNFFYKAPPSRLATIVEKQETGAIMKEIISILPMILVVVVCFLGLRKALSMLLTLLRRCLIILIRLVKILY